MSKSVAASFEMLNYITGKGDMSKRDSTNYHSWRPTSYDVLEVEFPEVAGELLVETTVPVNETLVQTYARVGANYPTTPLLDKYTNDLSAAAEARIAMGATKRVNEIADQRGMNRTANINIKAANDVKADQIKSEVELEVAKKPMRKAMAKKLLAGGLIAPALVKKIRDHPDFKQ